MAFVVLCLEVTQNLAQFTGILLSGPGGGRLVGGGLVGIGEGGQLDSPKERAVGGREG